MKVTTAVRDIVHTTVSSRPIFWGVVADMPEKCRTGMCSGLTGAAGAHETTTTRLLWFHHVDKDSYYEGLVN